jgi:hypothetical protein
MARPAPKVSKVRMNLEVHPDIKQLLEELKDETHSESMNEIIRRAVLMYAGLVRSNNPMIIEILAIATKHQPKDKK